MISDDRSAVALGIPLSSPRIFRIAYDTSAGLQISFDLGLAPEARHAEASFSFVIYSADPGWGFRSAAQRYYDLFPRSFEVRIPPACQGAWFVAPPLDSLGSTYRSFGLGFDMIALGKAPSQRYETWGLRYLPWDRARAITATAYTHQWAFYDPLGEASPPAYDAEIAKVQGEAATDPGDPTGSRLHREAAAALASTMRDINGRLLYERYRGYLTFYQNLDPLPGEATDWGRSVQREQVDRAFALAGSVGGGLGGIHLDSTSGERRWGAADDYDRTHWAAAPLPLTFSQSSGQVVERGILSMYGRIRSLGESLHAQGLVLSANFNGDERIALAFAGSDQIDVFGLEQGLVDRARTSAGMDRFAMLKRTLAGQRPVSTLDHKIGDRKLTPGQIDDRLQQDLFYGIFSGAFDATREADGEATSATWSTQENADRWARYSSIQRQLAAAGWEPITDARSSDPHVWVERFGPDAPGGRTFLTLRNEARSARTITLSVDLRALGFPAIGASAAERVGGANLTVSPSAGGTATITLTVPPRATRVVVLQER